MRHYKGDGIFDELIVSGTCFLVKEEEGEGEGEEEGDVHS